MLFVPFYEEKRYCLLRIRPCHIKACTKDHYWSDALDRYIATDCIEIVCDYCDSILKTDDFNEIIAKYERDSVNHYVPDGSFWVCWDNKNKEFITPSDD